MKSRMTFRALLIGCLVVLSSASAHAQLFGPRSIGKNSRGRNLTAPDAVGTVTEDRRFVRGSRAAGDFVGADKGETSAFVGNTQAVNDGTVTSAVTGLREQTTVRVNRPLTVRRTGIYAPRITVGFEVPPRIYSPSFSSEPAVARPGEVTPTASPVVSSALQQMGDRLGFQVNPSPTERVATLTGTVPTAHDRRIAELLASFEPGLGSVKNDLRVVPNSVKQHHPDQ